MVAARNIDPLELILTEEPAVVGPYSKTLIGCLQCSRKLNPLTAHPCSGCGFPVCDEKCEKGPLHRPECEFFRKRQEKVNIAASIETGHVAIAPLRMLLKKTSEPKTFARIDMLMDHLDKRSSNVPSLNGSNNCVPNLQLVKAIVTIRELAFMDEFRNDEIERMIGILKTNGMKLENVDGAPGVALYPIYCLINHACFNNTNYVKFPDLHLELRSQLPIVKGEEIFTRYISSTIGNSRRREDIQKYWFFDCECTRCRDTTEMGSYMSAVRCLDCATGFLLPVTWDSYEPDWACDACDAVLPHAVVDDVLTTIEKQVGENAGDKLSELEEMLFHYQKILHPNHYILIDLMHNLVHLYAAKDALSRPEKERKIQLCRIVLDTLGKVDPGFTKWRGTLLQELIHPLMMISKEDHNAGRIPEREFQRRLAFCSRKLREAKLCLWGGFTSVEQYLKDRNSQNSSK